MKFFDKESLEKEKLYDYYFEGRMPEEDGIKPIYENDKLREEDINDIIIIDDIAYVPCISTDKNNVFVKKLLCKNFTLPNGHQYGVPLRTFESISGAKCPYCGYVHEETLYDEKEEVGEFVCEECGSTFSYVKEIEISFYNYPVKQNENITVLR